MMMRWYKEHPVDGNAVARSISVGLPPDQNSYDYSNELEMGLVVPEADREVRK